MNWLRKPVDFDAARRIADAVLYEGYILYPYRASAQKNRLRWQFGVVAPRLYSEQSGSDPWATQTECLVEFNSEAILHVKLRFLQVQARNVDEAVDADGNLFRPAAALEIDGTTYITWEEGIEREIEAEVELRTVFDTDKTIPFELEGNKKREFVFNAAGKLAARIVRQSWPISGRVVIGASPVSGFPPVAKVRIRIENTRQCEQPFREREQALRHSLIATHLLLGAEQGKFISLLEPPDWATEIAGSCVNLHAWPVLVGQKEQANLLLSAPIILYDYPRIAPESSGDFFDATEIDELLALRTMTLTDLEKREAKFTDERGATVLDRIEAMPAETFARMHGTMRELRGTANSEQAAVWVNGVWISTGSKVRLYPGRRRADAQDMFLEGRVAIVKRVLRDVENKNYLAVTLVDDPAADLHEWYGRFHYFSPDEVEPAIESESATRFENKQSSETKVSISMQQRILIAGVGNIFLGDDGFGVEVVKRLALESMPESVRVADFGIKGIHLAFELLDKKYETTILVDAAARRGAPGTVYLIEPDLSEISENSSHDAHAMNPQMVLDTVRSLGAIPGKVYIVGCEPACTEEGIGLSELVSQAVEEAVQLILEIVWQCNRNPEANESLRK